MLSKGTQSGTMDRVHGREVRDGISVEAMGVKEDSHVGTLAQ